MAASLGTLVIRSSLADWQSMKKECRHARHNNKVYLSELEHWLQYCLRNLRIACKAAQVAIPLGEVKWK
jgi:hypothetical protein